MAFPFKDPPNDQCGLQAAFAATGASTPWSQSEWEAGFSCGIADPSKFNFLFSVLFTKIACLEAKLAALTPIAGEVAPQ